MEIRDKKYYPIREVSQITGVRESVIRFWEQNFDELQPLKNRVGQRKYMKRDIDIISFDAYNFTKEFLLYSTELKEFIGKGRSVAWGVVPTSEDIGKETAEGLHQRLSAAASSGLITPSCGVGTLGEHLARKVFEMTRQVSDIMQEKYGRKS